MFLISRVGNSDQARRFIEGIGRDPEVGSMVYTNTADISRKRELFDMIGDKAYTKWVSFGGFLFVFAGAVSVVRAPEATSTLLCQGTIHRIGLGLAPTDPGL